MSESDAGGAQYFNWFYFKLDGRVGRRAYWQFLFVPTIVLGLVLGIAAHESLLGRRDAMIAIFALSPLIIWVNIAVCSKRWHDVGYSAWWCILNFVPFVSYVVFFVLGFLPGQPGDNQFGPAPRPRPAAP